MSIAEQQAQRFGRFGEDRHAVGNDFDTYDDSDAPDPGVSLDTPIANDNIGYRMLTQMGWKSGRGLGRALQGRTEPVPLSTKLDGMGLGRMSVEMSKAHDVTEKRRQLEIEKEDTPELIQRYMNNLEKEQHIAESTADLRQTYYCESCDKQYKTYSEYDNHINSYDHAHRLRLKELRERDFNRKMAVHRKKKKGDKEKDRDSLLSQRQIALERAQMSVSRLSGKLAGGFTAAIPTDDGSAECDSRSSQEHFRPLDGNAGDPSEGLHGGQDNGRSAAAAATASAVSFPALAAKFNFTPVSFASTSPASNPLPPLPTTDCARAPGAAAPPPPKGAPSSRWGVAPSSATPGMHNRPPPPMHQAVAPPPPLPSAPPPPLPPPDDPPPPQPPAPPGSSLSFGFKKSSTAATSSSAGVAKAKPSLGFAKKPLSGMAGKSKMVAKSNAFGEDEDEDDSSEIAPALRGKFISGSSSRW